MAVGQSVDRAWYADAVGLEDGAAGPAGGSGSELEDSRGMAGVVVCGDAESGPATVVEAIASGRRAAAQVGLRLAGADSVPSADALPQSDGATRLRVPASRA